MLKFSQEPSTVIRNGEIEIASFIREDKNENIDWKTVESFGEEWGKFSSFSEEEIKNAGDQYFDIADTTVLHSEAFVLDVGCGSGRWSKYVAEKVKFVEAIDPSNAVLPASVLLKEKKNVRVSQASVDNIPFPDHTFDLVFSLGVLHHIPDTFSAIKKCVQKAKPGGYFMVYLYYSLDNRGLIFKTFFHLSNILRVVISKLPPSVKSFVCDVLAVTVYMPLVLFSRALDNFNWTRKLVKSIPLSYYRDKSFFIIRNDALDRFGTPLEQRFSKMEIKEMLEKAGLTDIKFSNGEPFWHAIGKKL